MEERSAELQRLVTGAKLGDDRAFGQLVRLYQVKLLSTVQAVVRDRDEAEDLVQETFLRAWKSLDSLREASAFPGWVGTIGRNLARSRLRSRSRDRLRTVDEPDLDRLSDPRTGSGAGPTWGALAGALSADQRRLWDLRHGAGLSLREVGAVLGIPENRVKSRLFAVRRRLESVLRSGRLPSVLEEKIMDKIQTLRLGAHVFERLSLAAQTELTLTVLAGEAFGQGLLASLGQTDRGAEFLALYGTRLALAELIGILNHVDRFTEARLVEHLEVQAPAEAERLKQNFFVFEDLLLFDSRALRLLGQTADRDLLVQALAGTERRVVLHVLGALDGADRADWELRIARADTDRRLVRAAQEQVIQGIKDLEQAGRLLLRRKGEVPDGEIYLTAR